MPDNRISKKVADILKIIQEKDFNSVSLNNFYNNALKEDNISELEREFIIAAVEKKIRIKDPRKAKQIFCSKDAQARELLDGIYTDLASEYDLSTNNVGPGVKTGGHMISGRVFVDVYFSYKNFNKWNLGLSIIQETVESAQIARVKLYQGGENNNEGKEITDFPIDQIQLAVSKYKNLLVTII